MEDYVTFEQAKALKELGFDWKTTHYYDENGILTASFEEISADGGHEYTVSINNLNGNFNLQNGEDDEWCSAPTLTQVQKWLFERHGYFLSVQYNSKTDKFHCVIYKQLFTQGYYCTNESYVEQTFQSSENLKSYEPFRCLSKGITKVLELLKKQ